MSSTRRSSDPGSRTSKKIGKTKRKSSQDFSSKVSDVRIGPEMGTSEGSTLSQSSSDIEFKVASGDNLFPRRSSASDIKRDPAFNRDADLKAVPVDSGALLSRGSRITDGSVAGRKSNEGRLYQFFEKHLKEESSIKLPVDEGPLSQDQVDDINTFIHRSDDGTLTPSKSFLNALKHLARISKEGTLFDKVMNDLEALKGEQKPLKDLKALATFIEYQVFRTGDHLRTEDERKWIDRLYNDFFKGKKPPYLKYAKSLLDRDGFKDVLTEVRKKISSVPPPDEQSVPPDEQIETELKNLLESPYSYSIPEDKLRMGLSKDVLETAIEAVLKKKFEAEFKDEIAKNYMCQCFYSQPSPTLIQRDIPGFVADRLRIKEHDKKFHIFEAKNGYSIAYDPIHYGLSADRGYTVEEIAKVEPEIKKFLQEYEAKKYQPHVEAFIKHLGKNTYSILSSLKQDSTDKKIDRKAIADLVSDIRKNLDNKKLENIQDFRKFLGEKMKEILPEFDRFSENYERAQKFFEELTTFDSTKLMLADVQLPIMESGVKIELTVSSKKKILIEFGEAPKNIGINMTDEFAGVFKRSLNSQRVIEFADWDDREEKGKVVFQLKGAGVPAFGFRDEESFSGGEYLALTIESGAILFRDFVTELGYKDVVPEMLGVAQVADKDNTTNEDKAGRRGAVSFRLDKSLGVRLANVTIDEAAKNIRDRFDLPVHDSSTLTDMIKTLGRNMAFTNLFGLKYDDNGVKFLTDIGTKGEFSDTGGLYNISDKLSINSLNLLTGCRERLGGTWGLDATKLFEEAYVDSMIKALKNIAEKISKKDSSTYMSILKLIENLPSERIEVFERFCENMGGSEQGRTKSQLAFLSGGIEGFAKVLLENLQEALSEQKTAKSTDFSSSLESKEDSVGK